jgi:hypothetical protein
VRGGAEEHLKHLKSVKEKEKKQLFSLFVLCRNYLIFPTLDAIVVDPSHCCFAISAIEGYRRGTIDGEKVQYA